MAYMAFIHMFHCPRQCISTATISRNQKLDVCVKNENVDTLRKKRASEPVRFGLFDTAAAALFAAVTDDSLASAAFFGLICIGINI